MLNKHAEIPEIKNVTVFLLGWCYQNGVGVVKDYKEAVRLFSLAAQKGDSDAQNTLGWCYRKWCWSCERCHSSCSSFLSFCSTRLYLCTEQSWSGVIEMVLEL